MIKGEQLLTTSSYIASFFAVNFTCIVPAFLWAYRDKLVQRNIENKFNFDHISRSLAVFFMAVLFYTLSFKSIWQYPFRSRYQVWTTSDYLIYLEPIILLLLTIFAWWRLKLSKNEEYYGDPNMFLGFDLTSIVVAILLILTGVLISCDISIAPITFRGVLFFNIFLGLLSFGLIRESLAQGKRFRFWSGIILIVLQIFTRMIEYDTDLLFKAFVFFLCGIGIIIAGLWFEKNARVLDS